MKRFFPLAGILLMVLAPLACQKTYTLGPLPSFTPTFTPTATATLVSTPGCGYSAVTVVVPIIPYITPTPIPTLSFTPTATPVGTPFVFNGFMPAGSTNYVIRNLADWQAYYGSTSAPPPPVDFNSQMLIINLQAQYTTGFRISWDWINIQSICWDTNKITVSCSLFVPCTGGGNPIYIIPLGTPTPGPTPTPIPPTWQYYATAIAVPISSLPVSWDVTSIMIGPCPQ